MKKRFMITLLLAGFMVFYNPLVWAENGLVRITDNVYSYLDVKAPTPQKSFGANAGIIIGKEFCIVVDSLISAKEAKRFIKDIETVTKKPVKYLVNTHYHLDHAYGNCEFSKMGVTIISHKNCMENIRKTGDAALKNVGIYGLSEEDMAGTIVSCPTMAFNESMTIDLGNITVELRYIRPSHSTGSIIVYIPQDKVLFTGDMLFTDYHPYMGDGNVEEWVKLIDGVMELDAQKIVPGHGPLSSKKDLIDMKEYLLEFDKTAKKLASTSNDAVFIAESLKKSLPQRSRLDSLITSNIQMKYLKKTEGHK